MRLTELRLENLRRFEQLELTLEPGWNAFVGANGAGKTTLLEAAFMLSHGHSFRAGGMAGIQRGPDGLRLAAWQPPGRLVLQCSVAASTATS